LKQWRRFYEGRAFCTKFNPLNYFSNDELRIILKHGNLEIAEHSKLEFFEQNGLESSYFVLEIFKSVN